MASTLDVLCAFFPLYYFALTFILFGAELLHSEVVSSVLPLPGDQWLNYCYLTNWLGLWKAVWGPGYTNFLAHFWSLYVEEQFYLAWPLIMWLARPRQIPYIAGILSLVAVVARIIWVSHTGPGQAIVMATITRMDSLFIGGICAYLFENREAMSRIKRWLPWGAIVGIGAFLFVHVATFFAPEMAVKLMFGTSTEHSAGDVMAWYSQTIGTTLLSVGFGCVVLMAATGSANSPSWRSVLRSRILGTIGKYSYGIYVYHVPVLGAAAIWAIPRIVRGATDNDIMLGPALMVALAAVTFGISALSYELFEGPILRLKRHFEPKYEGRIKSAAQA